MKIFSTRSVVDCIQEEITFRGGKNFDLHQIELVLDVIRRLDTLEHSRDEPPGRQASLQKMLKESLEKVTGYEQNKPEQANPCNDALLTEIAELRSCLQRIEREANRFAHEAHMAVFWIGRQRIINFCSTIVLYCKTAWK
jgi:hypothetical protein